MEKYKNWNEIEKSGLISPDFRKFLIECNDQEFERILIVYPEFGSLLKHTIGQNIIIEYIDTHDRMEYNKWLCQNEVPFKEIFYTGTIQKGGYSTVPERINDYNCPLGNYNCFTISDKKVGNEILYNGVKYTIVQNKIKIGVGSDFDHTCMIIIPSSYWV